jgi:hypothetical protein
MRFGDWVSQQSLTDSSPSPTWARADFTLFVMCSVAIVAFTLYALGMF